MTARVRATVAWVFALLCVCIVWSTASPAKADYDSQAMKQLAQNLDAAAATARQHPKGAVTIPELMLPEQLDSAPASPSSTSLNAWLQAELHQIRKEKTGAKQARELSQLAASLRYASQPEQNTHLPPLDPAAESAGILSQKAYAIRSSGAAPTPQPTLWERFLEWLGRIFGKLITAIFGATASVPLIGQLVAVLLILLLAALAAYLVYLLVAIITGRQRTSAVSSGTVLPPPLDPEALYNLSKAAAAQGRYAAAISYLFQASLAALDRRGVLAYDGSLTPGEYRRAVRRARCAASPAFDILAQRFVLAAFAEQPVSPSDWSAADAAYQSLDPLLAS